MARKNAGTGVDRRKILAGAARGGAATAIPAVKRAARRRRYGCLVQRPSPRTAQADMVATSRLAPGTMSGPAGAGFMST